MKKSSAEPAIDPASRPSRLPLLVHITVVFLLLAAFVSGVLVWYGETQNAASEDPTFPVTWWRRFHGVLNPFLCVVFGYLLTIHIRYGWALRANWVAGLIMELDYSVLILSGVGLYYAPESWRDFIIITHRVAGVILPVALGLHWAASLIWVKNLSR